MNKFKILLIAAALVFTSSAAMAQKTGYISLEQVLQIMPEVGKIDTLMQTFQNDSLNPQFAYLVQEYNRKDTMVNTKDSVKLTPTVKRQIRQEMADIEYQVQNWQTYAQNIMQAKQNQLLEPIYRKVYSAIQTVAKDNGYSYVYSREALLVGPAADDLLPLVAKKLNLKLPPTYTPGFKYQ
ncbi:MAG TPA: OmpH family outer membrane protein [Flavisolibacter sp.]|nr:OmpH family outer membrane protein [Flavisolibacter sp.]